MTKKNTREKIIEAALPLAADKGWDNVKLRDIADSSGLSLSDIHDHIDDRFDLLNLYRRIIDRKVLDNLPPYDETETPRDRLFDILMGRFDVLNENRDATKTLLDSARREHPASAAISLPFLGQSMSWMLDAAGIDTSGLTGCLKVVGLTAIYLKTLWVWYDDDSADMAKTMAALDKNLGHAETWVSRLGMGKPE